MAPMPRSAASCFAAAATLLLLAAATGTVDAVSVHATWPTAFQNTRNSAQSIFNGPDGSGSCPTDLLPDTENQAQYYHSGVLSLDNQRLYVGSSLNVVYIIEVASQSFVTVDLGPGNRVKGVVASPVVAPYGRSGDSGITGERVYVGSADGYVYGLDPVACQNETSNQAGCIVWSSNLGQPVLAPLHHTMHGINVGQHPEGILYVSTTSLVSDTDAKGVLFAVDPIGGDPLHRLNATSVNGDITYPIHAAPTIVDCPASSFLGIVFMPFGNRVVIVEPTTFQIIAELSTNDTISNDPFQSSASMSTDCSTLYIQSRSRRVWKLNITGEDLDHIGLSLLWRCEYTPTDSHCCVPPWCNINLTFSQYDVPEVHDIGDPTITNVYSTPAINDFNNQVVVGLTDAFVPSPDIKGGIYSVDQDTGLAVTRLLAYNGVELGSTRSTAAIDPNGGVFVATDALSGVQTQPVFFALNHDLTVRFVTALANAGVVVGGASTLLTENTANGVVTNYAVISGGNKIRSLSQGMTCPSASSNPLDTCSGNGVCNCKTGNCKCFDSCYTDDSCSVFKSCGDHGYCAEGICNCEVCYAPPDCSADSICSSHGTCTAVNGQSECSCNACFSGFNCELEETCSNHGNCQDDNGKAVCHCTSGWTGELCETPHKGGDSGAVVTVVVIVLLMMVGVAVWLLMQWRTGRGLFRPKRRPLRSKRTLDVIYETDEEHSAGGGASGAAAGKSYGTNYTTL